MSLEQNKAVVRKFFEDVLNTGDFTLIEQYISPDFVEHDELPIETASDLEGVTEVFKMVHTATSDFKVTIVDMIAEDDKVAVRMIWGGTHQGDFMGMPATGNTIAFDVFDMFRVQDGKITDHWGVSNTMKMMSQLGAFSEPE